MADVAAVPAPRKSGLSWLPWVLLVMVIGAVLSTVSALVYRGETENRRYGFQTEARGEANRIDVVGTVLGADLVRNEMTVRLEFHPQGALLNADGRTLAREARVLVNAASGATERVLAADRPAGSTDVVLYVYGDDATDYPFDHHGADLDMSVVSGEPGAAEAVPIVLDLDASAHGLRIDAAPDPAAEPGRVQVDMGIDRSRSTVAVASFIMALQWGLAMALLILLIFMLRGKRKPELGMFSWMGAMMFAFPALRNAAPGIPPVLGTLSDFLAFFCAEGIVALVLLTSVLLWLFPRES